MDQSLPSMILTGASGFVGRHLLEAARGRYRIYAIARRSQREAGVVEHPNISWIQVDIGEWAALKRAMHHVKELGGADFLVHLAAYYDFSFADHPEYIRTNVNGTRHMLEQAKWLSVRRFVFASSLAACRFESRSRMVTESDPADARHAYGAAKAAGEAMCRHYSRWFPCSVVRLGAVFSDWCEYAPLYMFLSTWLSSGWRSRLLGGRGKAGVSYIHVNDVTRFLLTTLERTNELSAYGMYIASPDGCVTHRELYETAVRYFWDQPRNPILVPKPLAGVGIVARDWIGRVIGRRPFERSWMIQFIDRQLKVDAASTRKLMGWRPTPRLHIVRRLPFLIENMKSCATEWRLRNESVLERGTKRPNLLIHGAMLDMREEILDHLAEYVRAPENRDQLSHYRRMAGSDLHWVLAVIFRLLAASVRTEDRSIMLNYTDEASRRWFAEGVRPEEIIALLGAIGRLISEDIKDRPELAGLEREIHGRLGFTVQLAMDRVEDCYERFSGDTGPVGVAESRPARGGRPGRELLKMIERLDAFYEPASGEDRNGREVGGREGRPSLEEVQGES